MYALRGLSAGSSSVTTELRVLLLRLLDAAKLAFPALILHAYVDDPFQFVAGSLAYVLRIFPAATRMLANGLYDLKLDVSETKPVGLASIPAAASALT